MLLRNLHLLLLVLLLTPPPPPSCSRARGGCSRVGRLEMLLLLYRSSSSALPSSSSRTVMTLSDLHSHDQRMQCAQELNPKTSPLVDEAWAGVLEALLCRRAVFSVDVSQLQLSTSLAVSVPESEKKTNPRSKGYRKSTTTTTTTTINKTKTFAELVARHIPPSILLEDVAAFTQWLARPDRPNLVRGRSLQFVFAGEGEDNIAAGKKGKDISSATTTSSSSSPLLLLATGPRCSLYRFWLRPSPRRRPTMLSYQPRPTRPRVDYFLGRASRRSESCTAYDPRCSLRAWL